jgi:hypothetical protein
MDVLEAIEREERKLEKELGKLQQQLNGVRAAAKALGSKASREVAQIKKRVMSAAARAKISRATKARGRNSGLRRTRRQRPRDRTLCGVSTLCNALIVERLLEISSRLVLGAS